MSILNEQNDHVIWFQPWTVYLLIADSSFALEECFWPVWFYERILLLSNSGVYLLSARTVKAPSPRETPLGGGRVGHVIYVHDPANDINVLFFYFIFWWKFAWAKFVSHDITDCTRICSHNLVRGDYHMSGALKKMNGGLNFYEKALILWNKTF